MREVAECLVLDLPVFAIGPPKQMGFVDAILVDASCSGHVDGTVSGWHVFILNRIQN
jgi:hypothetical protein